MQLDQLKIGADAGARLAIRLLQDAAQRGELDPWDVDVIAVVDGFLDQLRQRIEIPKKVCLQLHRSGGSYEKELADLIRAGLLDGAGTYNADLGRTQALQTRMPKRAGVSRPLAEGLKVEESGINRPLDNMHGTNEVADAITNGNEIFPNISKQFEIFRNISEHFKIFRNMSKHSEIV